MVTAIVVSLVYVGAAYECTGFGGSTVWQWLRLLIVPLVLAIGGYLFNRALKMRELEAQTRRARHCIASVPR
jgi:hypothetical protein